ncbi:MAG: hypothetical protein RIS47_806 [Bacteroidota bacterium]|jgi:uncharacterized membrane protein YjjB (DUF3815 family)
MEILLLFEKGVWAGFAALGFAVLFNVPVRTLFAIWALGAIGGFAKYSTMSLGLDIISASLIGASLAGTLSIPLAHKIHAPPVIFSIPAVIPMVPGAFAYRMILGLLKMSVGKDIVANNELMVSVVQNGMKVILILLSLAVGVAGPMLITRRESAKRIRLPKI